MVIKSGCSALEVVAALNSRQHGASLHMGQTFSLPGLLGITDAGLESLEPELLLYVVRMLIRDEPAAIGRLICCCQTLAARVT